MAFEIFSRFPTKTPLKSGYEASKKIFILGSLTLTREEKL
jgi:hypothetical protein